MGTARDGIPATLLHFCVLSLTSPGVLSEESFQ